jgi:hypothetical protein
MTKTKTKITDTSVDPELTAARLAAATSLTEAQTYAEGLRTRQAEVAELLAEHSRLTRESAGRATNVQDGIGLNAELQYLDQAVEGADQQTEAARTSYRDAAGNEARALVAGIGGGPEAEAVRERAVALAREGLALMEEHLESRNVRLDDVIQLLTDAGTSKLMVGDTVEDGSEVGVAGNRVSVDGRIAQKFDTETVAATWLCAALSGGVEMGGQLRDPEAALRPRTPDRWNRFWFAHL